MTTQEVFKNIEQGFDLAIQKGLFCRKDTVKINETIDALLLIIRDYEQLKKESELKTKK